MKESSLEGLNYLSDVIKGFTAELGIEPSSPQCHRGFNAERGPFTAYPVTLGEFRATVAKPCSCTTSCVRGAPAASSGKYNLCIMWPQDALLL